MGKRARKLTGQDTRAFNYPLLPVHRRPIRIGPLTPAISSCCHLLGLPNQGLQRPNACPRLALCCPHGPPAQPREQWRELMRSILLYFRNFGTGMRHSPLDNVLTSSAVPAAISLALRRSADLHPQQSEPVLHASLTYLFLIGFVVTAVIVAAAIVRLIRAPSPEPIG